MSIQVSRSAFRRVGDTINMKPGVDVLKVGTVDVTGITLDTNYAATYYPWVKIIDTSLAKPVWVPPSVVLGGVIAYTDK